MTYTDYRNIYGGLVREERFNAFLPRAVSEVDAWLTAEVTTSTFDAYVKCIGELVDLFDTPDTTVETVGGAFRNYAQTRTIEGIIKRHLGRTGLIYQGI